MGDRLGDSNQIMTPGPVIPSAASFWYSIKGWEKSLLMRDDSAQTCVLDLRESEVLIKVSVYSAVNEYRLDRGC